MTPQTLLKTVIACEFVIRNIVGAITYIIVLGSFACIGALMGGMLD